MTAFLDLSRLSPPAAIESTNVEAMLAEHKAGFLAAWDRARALDPSLPTYDTLDIETDPANIALQTISYRRYLDRCRVNDATDAVLAMRAKGSNLDHVAAGQGISRQIVVPANPDTGEAAVMEGDAQLLRRYLLSFERPSAGSRNRFLLEAFQAFPVAGDVAVVGYATHGRRGDVDIVVAGPGGRDATDAELAAVRAAVLAPNVAPEAVAVSVIRAQRLLYSVDLVLDIPLGPDRNVVAREAATKVKAATDERTVIGAEVPLDYVSGPAYVPNVIEVHRKTPAAAVQPSPYGIPVCESISVRAEVSS